jgi:hypothetical protein
MQKSTAGKSQFLTEEEIQILKNSSSISGIAGQRAKALLLVNSGMTQLAAGNEAGLTRGQVKYVVAKYGRDGISAFQTAESPTIKVKAEKTEVVKPVVTSEIKEIKLKIKKEKKKDKKSKPSDKKSQPQPKKMKKADKKKKKDKKKNSSKKKDKKKKDNKKKDSKKKDKKKKDKKK